MSLVIGLESVGAVELPEIEWITIPGGPYTYGKSGHELNDIKYDFKIMKFEVTNRQYLTFLNSSVSLNKLGAVNDSTVQGYYAGDKFWNPGDREYLDLDDKDCRIHWKAGQFYIEAGFEEHPVVEVTWFGANAFASFYGYKLPSEKAWEKAARGNTGFKYPWGDDDPSCMQANSYDCLKMTREVYNDLGLSPYGVANMAGNVSEWTRSYFSSRTHVRVLRGGGWDGLNGNLLSYRRDNEDPTESTKSLGFRCIKL